MIFYGYAKGCGLKTTSTDSGLWTWLVFSNGSSGSETLDSQSYEFLPNIKINSKNNTGGWTDFGKIITSEATGQSVKKEFSFEEDVTVKKKLRADVVSANTVTLKSLVCNIPWGRTETVVSQNYWNNQVTTAFCPTSNATFGRNLYAAGTITANNHVEAPYFNATSDKRAKCEIEQAHFDATSFVNNLQIYTFRYKESGLPSIGIIAQEAKELDGRIKDFSLVDNLAATGENGDYMTVKESKLVYILWKANQELSARIRNLEEQIKKTPR